MPTIKKGRAESALPLWMMVLFQQPAIGNAIIDRLPPRTVCSVVLRVSVFDNNQLHPYPRACGT